MWSDVSDEELEAAGEFYDRLVENGGTNEGFGVMTVLDEHEDDYDPVAHRPPKDEPHGALVLLSAADQFVVLGHTGWLLYGEIEEAGLHNDELCIAPSLTAAADEPGYYAMRDGDVIDVSSWEDLHAEYELRGEWRPATLDDFEHFNVPLPEMLEPLVEALIIAAPRMHRYLAPTGNDAALVKRVSEKVHALFLKKLLPWRRA